MSNDMDDAELIAILKSTEGTTFEPAPVGTWEKISARLDSAADSPQKPDRLAGGMTRRALWVAAGGLVVGGGVGYLLRQPDIGRIIAEIPLRSLDSGIEEGQAKVRDRGGSLILELDIPKAMTAQNGYVEVWLGKADLSEMVSVGMYSGRPVEQFPVSPDVLKRGFVVVDLSHQLFNGDNTHSGVSLARGVLPV